MCGLDRCRAAFARDNTGLCRIGLTPGMKQTALFLPDPYNARLISNIDTRFLFGPLLSVAYVALFAAFAPMAYRGWPCA
jgi:hypothetical protein